MTFALNFIFVMPRRTFMTLRENSISDGMISRLSLIFAPGRQRRRPKQQREVALTQKREVKVTMSYLILNIPMFSRTKRWRITTFPAATVLHSTTRCPKRRPPYPATWISGLLLIGYCLLLIRSHRGHQIVLMLVNNYNEVSSGVFC